MRNEHKIICTTRMFIINERCELLLVRKASRQMWHAPGGGVEKGELSKAGVVRECKEELSLLCTHVRLVCSTRIESIPGVVEKIDCYTGRPRNLDRIKPKGNEVDLHGWFALHEVCESVTVTKTTKLLMQQIELIALFTKKNKKRA